MLLNAYQLLISSSHLNGHAKKISGITAGGENSQDRSQMMAGQIVTDSDEEDDDDKEDSKEIFDSAALAAF
ncbi:hypothetical protein Tco_0712241 [Tanacetum coccineum]